MPFFSSLPDNAPGLQKLSNFVGQMLLLLFSCIFIALGLFWISYLLWLLWQASSPVRAHIRRRFQAPSLNGRAFSHGRAGYTELDDLEQEV